MNPVRNTLAITLGLLLVVVSGCNRNNFECEEGYIYVTNPAQDPDSIVICGWGTNQPSDTIHAGETIAQPTGDISYERNFWGTRTQTSTERHYFSTNGGTYIYDITQCETYIDAPGGYVYLAADCDNGAADYVSGELGVDCGGYCKPCADPELSCTPESNYIDFELLFGADGSLTSAQYSQFFSDSWDAEWTFSTLNELKATFNIEDMPAGTRAFEIGNLDHQMTLKYNEGWGFWYADSGQEVYLFKDDDGTYRLVFCDLSFTKDNFTVTAIADLELDY